MAMPVSFCFHIAGNRTPETELISGYSLPMKIGLVDLWIKYLMEKIKACAFELQALLGKEK
jgi:hypothetical protein